MKRPLLTQLLRTGLSMLTVCISAGSLYAQNPFAEKSEILQMKEMDAFSNPDVTVIPYEGRSLYKNRKRLTENKSLAPKYPLQTNPALAQKIQRTGADGLDPAGTLHANWGTVTTIEDGKQYIYTQEDEPSPAGRYYYRSATFTIYNENLEEIKKFKVNSSDTTQYFSLISPVSSKVFNYDSEWEFAVATHGFSGNAYGQASCRDSVIIVNENSVVLQKLPNTASASILKTKSGKYQLMTARPQYWELYDKTQIAIFDPKSVCETSGVMPDTLFTYEVDDQLLSYSYGPIFELMDVAGQEYYVTTRYQKPFVANDDQMNPEWEKNNRYIITMYNTDFEIEKEIELPLIGQDQHDVSMSLIGDFPEYMFTRNTFNTDDKLEIIYGMSRYYTDCDCEKIDYYLVNEDGEILKEITNKAAGYVKLQDLPGQGDEYALLQGSSDGIEAITMYKMPEMEEVYTFPALHNGELLSMSFERISTKDGYGYIFGLGKGENADNTVYGGIAFYDLKGKMTKRIRIELGNEIALFNPIITPSTLNPYIFVADEQMEFPYFAKKYTEQGTVANSFSIANETENLYTWENDDENNIILSVAGVMTDADASYLKYLYVSHMSNDRESVSTAFYSLPLQSVQLQGEGTEMNPYQISSPAELDQVRNYPEACFELTQDIDMSQYTGVDGKGFNSIPAFKGTFDGKNYTISNIILHKTGMFAGLFTEISDQAVVKNLQMRNIEWNEFSNIATGTIVGQMLGGSIDNCHVTATLQSDQEINALGGIAGKMVNYATIANSSFEGELTVKNGSNIGGIAGQMTSGSTISNCASHGKIEANKNVGGIAGNYITESHIENTYSTMHVKGVQNIGGIAGNGSGQVARNYATGNIEADIRENEKWIVKAGGIAGNVSGSAYGECSLNNNVALNTQIVMPENAARVAYTNYDESGNNSYLKSNYALADMLIGADAEHLGKVNENDAVTVGADRIHGQSVTKQELTQTFYEDMGWKFGKDSLNPWVMTEEYPRLWFEYSARSVKLNKDELTLGVNDTFQLKAEVYPELAANKNVRYESSDLKVAVVSATGEITARNLGTAVITVKTEDGGYTDECVVHVVVPVESIEIGMDTLQLYVYESITLEANVTPEDATNKNVFWKSLAPNVVSASGGIIIGLNPGEGFIVAEAEGGENIADTCLVQVFAPVEDLYLNESMITLDKNNPTFQLVATIKPEEAAGVPLIWESEDTNVATVDENGLVSAQRKGETIVTVYTTDRKQKADCLVIVSENVGKADMEQNNGIQVHSENGCIYVNSAKEMEQIQVTDMDGRILRELSTNGHQANVTLDRQTVRFCIVSVKLSDGTQENCKVAL